MAPALPIDRSGDFGKVGVFWAALRQASARPGQPCGISGTDEEPVRLVRANAILVLPPAIACEDHNALRRIPHQFAHIEGESILSQVFSRPKVTRPERLARLATTFRPMHDHEAV